MDSKASSKKWIAGAVKHPGAFTKKADAAGMSVQGYAAKVTKPGSGASTQTKRQANLAKTFKKMGASAKAGMHHEVEGLIANAEVMAAHHAPPIKRSGATNSGFASS